MGHGRLEEDYLSCGASFHRLKSTRRGPHSPFLGTSLTLTNILSVEINFAFLQSRLIYWNHKNIYCLKSVNAWLISTLLEPPFNSGFLLEKMVTDQYFQVAVHSFLTFLWQFKPNRFQSESSQPGVNSTKMGHPALAQHGF